MKKPQALIGLLAALGTAIGVLVAVVGLPYGRLNYTAFAGLYHYGGTPAIGVVDFSIDCDTVTPGIQDKCNVPFGPGTRDVGLVIENNTASAILDLSSFNFETVNPDTSKIVAPAVGVCPFDCNPDFNQAQVTGSWSCSPPTPVPDDEGLAGYPGPAVNNPATQHSFLSCFVNDTGPDILPGTALTVAFVHYNINYTGPAAATVTLTTENFSAGNTVDGIPTGSCNPAVDAPVQCFPADLIFAPPTPTPVPPTATVTLTPVPATATNTVPPTNTFTPVPPTNTPTLTPTATNTPAGARVVKSPEGNANNTGPDPKANLWICIPNFAPYHLGALGNPTTSYNAAQTGETCGGPGEGDLLVYEKASGVSTGDQNADTVPDGLGAYEFTIEYDNFVIQSVNPCDLVFNPANNVVSGKGGAGDPPRGPVDQVNGSHCPNDPNGAATGQCTQSLILENVIHFGCVTTGQAPGPTGAFDLAVLDLIPHPDLRNDIFPGNNNGVVTIIKDNGCELVDVFGHAVDGSINGGLTPVCGDLAVTVRMLEGDINLDCQVNVTDEQAIASHYGAFFGSLLYSKFLDLEPALHDLDIDIKDIQKVFGRDGSTCQNPIPAQTPVGPPAPFS